MQAMIALRSFAAILFMAMSLTATDLEKKAQAIIIPRLKLEDASAAEVFELLQQAAREHDPDGIGINILYCLSPRGKHLLRQKTINMHLDDVPVAEVVRYVHLITNLYYRFDRYALLIFDSESEAHSLTTRSYPVEAGVFNSRRSRGKAERIDESTDER